MYVRGLFICLFTSLFFWEIIRADIGGMLVHSVLKSNQIAQHVIADAAGKTHKANGGPFYYFTFDLLLTVSFGWASISNPVFPFVTTPTTLPRQQTIFLLSWVSSQTLDAFHYKV